MLFDPSRHEPLQGLAWDEGQARAAIERIVAGTRAAFGPQRFWPPHRQDLEGPTPRDEGYYLFYCGAAGVVWALRYLQSQGACEPGPGYGEYLDTIVERNRVDLEAGDAPFGAYLMGDTPLRMMQFADEPTSARADAIAQLVEATIEHPAREFMWGSPGTMLAALFMHQRTGDPRWSALYLRTAAMLESQLEWSGDEQCHFWSQDLYGRHTNYLDGVHGFVATAPPLVKGRHLMAPGQWERWHGVIAKTVRRNAEVEEGGVNWRAHLSSPRGGTKLLQYCHGAPGFVICLGDWPDDSLDDLLLGAAELTWKAGPLTKGSNLCHGTGGNGYAFLKLFKRTGDQLWLDRARAFAMHGIAQTDAALREHGQLRHSLWTGDPGFAIYLMECIRGGDAFPSVDCFFG